MKITAVPFGDRDLRYKFQVTNLARGGAKSNRGYDYHNTFLWDTSGFTGLNRIVVDVRGANGEHMTSEITAEVVKAQ